MRWEIINTDPIVPRCIFCNKTTNQMARFLDDILEYKYICSSCGRFVKDAMEKWIELKPKDWIESGIFDSKNIDKVLEEHGHKCDCDDD